MAFHLVRCGRGFVFQSLLDPRLYLAVDHCPKPVQLRSNRFCRWIIEPLDCEKMCTQQECLDCLSQIKPVSDSEYSAERFASEENKAEKKYG